MRKLPLPLRFHIEESTGDATIRDGQNYRVADSSGRFRAEDAPLICNAVNAFDAMREALLEMCEAADDGSFYSDYDEACARLGRARAALSLATSPEAAR